MHSLLYVCSPNTEYMAENGIRMYTNFFKKKKCHSGYLLHNIIIYIYILGEQLITGTYITHRRYLFKLRCCVWMHRHTCIEPFQHLYLYYIFLALKIMYALHWWLLCSPVLPLVMVMGRSCTQPIRWWYHVVPLEHLHCIFMHSDHYIDMVNSKEQCWYGIKVPPLKHTYRYVH